jgi:hypothetical protein
MEQEPADQHSKKRSGNQEHRRAETKTCRRGQCPQYKCQDNKARQDPMIPASHSRRVLHLLPIAHSRINCRRQSHSLAILWRAGQRESAWVPEHPGGGAEIGAGRFVLAREVNVVPSRMLQAKWIEECPAAGSGGSVDARYTCTYDSRLTRAGRVGASEEARGLADPGADPARGPVSTKR